MEEVRFCAWCGKIVNLKFHYCPWCGKNLYNPETPESVVNRVVEEITNIDRIDKIASLEKMESQLVILDEEISALIDD